MSIDRLTPDDKVVLWPDQIWPQDVGALVLLDGSNLLDASGGFRIEVVRDAVRSRLHLAPRFRQVLHVPRRGLGGPLWVDAPAFDISDHVGVVALPAPGDEEQLLLEVERLRRRRLDRSRPLWEMWFLTGLSEQRVGLFVRLHHVMSDGMAAMATMAAFLDTEPDAAPVVERPWTPESPPSARELIVENLAAHGEGLARACSALARPRTTLRRALATWPALRELVGGGPAPRTSLNRLVGPDRRLALFSSDIDAVKEIAHANDAKVNDVLVTAIAGGVRGLLRSRGESLEQVRIYVPVSLRQSKGADATGNLISQMVVPLFVSVSDPVRRLQAIAAETAVRKAKPRPPLGGLFRNRIVSPVLLKLVARRRVNVTSADIAGPPQPLYFAGAELLEVFPLLNLIGNVSLGVAALSYSGRFGVMVVADGDAYPDLDVFAANMLDELRALGAPTHPASKHLAEGRNR